MSPPFDAPQRISRLAPLDQVWAAIDRLASPVPAKSTAVSAAPRRILAADVVAVAPQPPAAAALRDGWAVRAETVADAGAYSPAPLMPAPAWVDAGDAMPPATDAVLAPDAVALSASVHEAIAPASPGEGVLPAGADATPGCVLRRGGETVRETDVPVFRAGGVATVQVREPTISLLVANRKATDDADTLGPWLARAVASAGGVPRLRARPCRDIAGTLAGETADAVIVIGGTGAGREDRTVRALAAAGRVDLHGMAIQPGETAALGAVGGRPVLLVPGRLDAALAAWLLVGTRLMRCLTGSAEPDASATGILLRKIVSTIGIAQMVLVCRRDNGLAPVAGPYLPLQAIAQAHGWVFVPPESEGYPAGAAVEVRALP
jgi:molybdopterin biosynthesis enzyme